MHSFETLERFVSLQKSLYHEIFLKFLHSSQLFVSTRQSLTMFQVRGPPDLIPDDTYLALLVQVIIS
jgi:hypothetical protein